MTKPTDETTVALMGKDISQIQKDLASLSTKFEMFANTRFVTSNEMQLYVKSQVDLVNERLATSVNEIKSSLSWIMKIGLPILMAILLAVVAAVMKGILKV